MKIYFRSQEITKEVFSERQWKLHYVSNSFLRFHRYFFDSRNSCVQDDFSVADNYRTLSLQMSPEHGGGKLNSEIINDEHILREY